MLNVAIWLALCTNMYVHIHMSFHPWFSPNLVLVSSHPQVRFPLSYHSYQIRRVSQSRLSKEIQPKMPFWLVWWLLEVYHSFLPRTWSLLISSLPAIDGCGIIGIWTRALQTTVNAFPLCPYGAAPYVFFELFG